jgi:Trk K+ transport system NAD-binding subunit
MLVDPGTPMEDASDKEAGEDDFIPRGDYVYSAGHRILLIAKNGTEMEIKKTFGEKQ